MKSRRELYLEQLTLRKYGELHPLKQKYKMGEIISQLSRAKPRTEMFGTGLMKSLAARFGTSESAAYALRDYFEKTTLRELGLYCRWDLPFQAICTTLSVADKNTRRTFLESFFNGNYTLIGLREVVTKYQQRVRVEALRAHEEGRGPKPDLRAGRIYKLGIKRGKRAPLEVSALPAPLIKAGLHDLLAQFECLPEKNTATHRRVIARVAFLAASAKSSGIVDQAVHENLLHAAAVVTQQLSAKDAHAGQIVAAYVRICVESIFPASHENPGNTSARSN